MEELLTDFIKGLFGALLALMGSYYQIRVSEKNTKARLKAEKLERAYFLCQAIYDGHKREIANARKNLPHYTERYIEERRHPGVEMSELKMLIRGYIPSLAPLLESIDNGHAPLKKAFTALDNQVLSKEPFASGDPEGKLRTWEAHLQAVSKGSSAIKSGIEKELNSLTK